MKLSTYLSLIASVAISVLVTFALTIGMLVVVHHQRPAIPAVLDPNHPRFDPKQFRFEHYVNESPYFTKALVRMFPPGTDKVYIDKVIVERSGGAALWHEPGRCYKPGYNRYTYIWPVWPLIETLIFLPRGTGGRDVHILFDENNKSVMMKNGGKLLYGKDPNEPLLRGEPCE